MPIKLVLPVIGLAIVSAIIVGLILLSLFDNERAAPQEAVTSPAAESNLEAIEHALTRRDGVDIPEHIINKHLDNSGLKDLDTIIAMLKNDFAHKIKDIAFQVSLKELKQDLIKSDTKQGASHFAYAIESAFPELAASVLSNVETMEVYDAWLKENFVRLNELSLYEQQGELWIKRRELFGDAAEDIWSDNLSLENERRMAVNYTINLLDTAYDLPLQDKARILQSAYDNNYLGTVEDLAVDSRGLLSQVMFGLDSVQKELQALDTGERQKKMEEIRRTMGFSEEAIQQMAALDQAADAQWNNGYDYMQAREKAVQRLAGEELEIELDTLREQYFQKDASTIKREEEDLGLFRFDRQRVYGRN